jgi:YfiH family protein
MFCRTVDAEGSVFLFKTSILAGYTTRSGGVSKEKFSSLNLYYGRGDKKENIVKNYIIFKEKLHFFGPMVFPEQIHGSSIYVINRKIKKDTTIKDVDGLITDQKGIFLGVKFADCLPLLIYGKRYAGIFHCGWSGIVKHIVRRAIGKMQYLGENVSDLTAVIGPNIQQNSYKVGSEVVEEFEKAGFPEAIYKKNTGKYYLSMEKAVVFDLEKSNVKKNYSVKEDTYSKKEKFFSFRRDGSQCGEMVMFFIL